MMIDFQMDATVYELLCFIYQLLQDPREKIVTIYLSCLDNTTTWETEFY